ncbi:MAG: hypothetical protein Q8O51_02400 [bacterium]|nr:hypothetical protein [bacterium]
MGIIGTLFGLLVLASVSLLIVVTLWRAMVGSNTSTLQRAAELLPRMDGKNNQPVRFGMFTRMNIALGTAFGSLAGWWLHSNNRRARTILLVLTLGTLAFTFIYLPYAYRQAQPNGLRDAVLTETFGQQPLSGESMVRSAYIPNPDDFYGTAKPQKSVPPQTHPVKSILWFFFWMFAFLPFAWTCAILYAVVSLREETWKGTRTMVTKVRDWISNLSESGIRGTRSAGGVQGGLTFSTPIVMTASGAAVAEADKSKANVPWAKIMQWLKRNSGEIVAGLFVIDEVLELGMRRSNKKRKEG